MAFSALLRSTATSPLIEASRTDLSRSPSDPFKVLLSCDRRLLLDHVFVVFLFLKLASVFGFCLFFFFFSKFISRVSYA